MTDIVERLRLIELIEQLRQAALTRDDYRWEAADTITALRAEVASKNEQFQKYARKMESDMNDLGAENARLTARIRELEEALGFYANPANRRDGRFKHQVDPDNGHNVLVSIPSSYIKDGGKRAAAVLRGETNDCT